MQNYTVYKCRQFEHSSGHHFNTRFYRSAIPPRTFPESRTSTSNETNAGEPAAATECHADAPDAGDDASVLHKSRANELVNNQQSSFSKRSEPG